MDLFASGTSLDISLPRCLERRIAWGLSLVKLYLCELTQSGSSVEFPVEQSTALGLEERKKRYTRAERPDPRLNLPAPDLDSSLRH